MNGVDLLELWEQQYGKLSEAWRQQFLDSSEAQKIRTYPHEEVIEAIRQERMLAKILSNLQGLTTTKPAMTRSSTSARRSRQAPNLTRKIASGKGRGFRQAEEDEKNWRNRF